MGADKVPNWECSFMHREKGLFLSVYVDDLKNRMKEGQSESHVEQIDETC